MNTPLNNTSFFLDLRNKTLVSDYNKFILNRLAIVVSPHHDDESIGMAGTIARLIDYGFNVYILYVTSEKLDLKSGTNPLNRKAETIAAVSVLGVNTIDNISFLDFEDGNLKEFSLNYSKSVEILKSKIHSIEFKNGVIDQNGNNLNQGNTLVLTTSRYDAHRDHEETFNMIKNALRKRIILEFPTVNHMASCYVPNCIIDISDFFFLKEKALKNYTGEIKKNRILWDDIFALDELTGKKINVDYAENCFISWYGLLNN